MTENLILADGIDLQLERIVSFSNNVQEGYKRKRSTGNDTGTGTGSECLGNGRRLFRCSTASNSSSYPHSTDEFQMESWSTSNNFGAHTRCSASDIMFDLDEEHKDDDVSPSY